MDIKSVTFSAPSDSCRWGGSVSYENTFMLLEVEQKEDADIPASRLGQKILEDAFAALTAKQPISPRHAQAVLQTLNSNPEAKAAVIGTINNGILHVAGMGECRVLLSRGGKVGSILQEEGVVNGKVQPGDRLLVCAEPFYRDLKHEHLEGVLSAADLEEAGERLSQVIIGSARLKGNAALILSVEEKRELPASNPAKHLRKTIDVKASAARFRHMIGSPLSKLTGKISSVKTLSKKKKILLAVIAVSIILLGGNVLTGVSSAKNAAKITLLSEAMTIVSQQYEEATSLIDLNAVRSRTLLSSAKMSLTPFLKDFPKDSKENKQIHEWLEKIAAAEVAAYHMYKLTAVPEYFDITLIRPGGEGAKLAAYEETKAILDTKNKAVYLLKTPQKQAQVLAGPDAVKDGRLIAIHGKTVYVQNSSGITSIDTVSKAAKQVVAREETWGDPAAFAAYSGNLYLLDRTHSAIWKFLATEDGFTRAQRYLNTPSVNFATGASLAIDGSIWVLTAGEITKTTGGNVDPFTIQGFSDTLQNLQSISTSETDKNIYVLDTTLARIVVFDKEGVYQSQYQWDGLKKAADIVADESERTIYVLIGSKIHAIEIK